MKLFAPFILVFCAVSVFGALFSRSDAVGEWMGSSEGAWGKWGDARYCDYGKYAVGFWLNVEGRQYNGDDSAANSFLLQCDNERIYVDNYDDAIYGTWAYVGCDGMPMSYYGFLGIERNTNAIPGISTASPRMGPYIKGFQSKVESPQGSGQGNAHDDSALNSIKALCTNERAIEPANAGPWGAYTGEMVQCPAGAVVCGYMLRIEEKQGDYVPVLNPYPGDDTSLNAVQLRCCMTKKVYSNARGYWQQVLGTGGGAIVKEVVTIGITDYREESFSQENAASLEESLSAETSFTYDGVGGKMTAQLTHSQSETVTSTSVHGLTRTIVQQTTLECEPGKKALYQYVTDDTESGANQESWLFKIKSKSYWCVSDNNLRPQCPFFYCADMDCQHCKEKMGSSSIAAYDVRIDKPKQYYNNEHEFDEFKPVSNGVYFKLSQTTLVCVVGGFVIIALVICMRTQKSFVALKYDSDIENK